MSRTWFIFRLALAAVVLVLASGPLAGAQECVWSNVARVVAVGDVHGDFDQLVKVLRAAEVIDATNRWVGGKTHLVQTGDVLDRAPDSRKAMDLLMDLEKQAAEAGGAVHALIGNHEAMVLMRDLGYVHPGELASFGGKDAYLEALSPQGKYGKWIMGHNAVIEIDGVLFAHGGLSPVYADQPLEKINEAIRGELANIGKTNSRPSGIMGPSGPLWFRGLATDEEKTLDSELAPVFKAYNAKRIVMGHTVLKGAITVRAGGRVLIIDVGMSRAYGGPATCLVIEGDKYYSVRPDGKTELPVDR